MDVPDTRPISTLKQQLPIILLRLHPGTGNLTHNFHCKGGCHTLQPITRLNITVQFTVGFTLCILRTYHVLCWCHPFHCTTVQLRPLHDITPVSRSTIIHPPVSTLTYFYLCLQALYQRSTATEWAFLGTPWRYGSCSCPGVGRSPYAICINCAEVIHRYFV